MTMRNEMRANRAGLIAALTSVVALAMATAFTLTDASASAAIGNIFGASTHHHGSRSRSSTTTIPSGSGNTGSGTTGSGNTGAGNTGSGDTGGSGSGSGNANNSSATVTPTVLFEESNGTTTCYSTGTSGGVSTSNTNGTCTINDLVGDSDEVPADTPTSTTLTFTNVGNVPSTVASMVASSCTVAAASDNDGFLGSDTAGFCGEVDVTISNTTSGAADKCVYPTQVALCPALSSADTLDGLAGSTFNAAPLSTLAAGASATYVIDVELDASASNADQGLAASMPLSWSISQ